MRMETKEMNFKGFKMNGFLALFLFLLCGRVPRCGAS